jgi:hypothetical protein
MACLNNRYTRFIKNYFMKKSFLTATLFILLTACGPSVRVFYDRDENANVANYKTYSWLNEKAIEAKGLNPLYYNELTDQRIKNAVNREMQAKGFVLVENKGELELHYHIIVENKTSETTEPYNYTYTPYWRKVSIYHYREGTLIIDIMDRQKNTLVWRGYATGVITYQTTAKPEEAINYAVTKIFKSFPLSSK